MSLYVKMTPDGAALAGLPGPRPMRVDATIAGVLHRHTSTEAWTDGQLAQWAGYARIDPASEYDPEIHTPTGGGTVDPQTGLATPAFTVRSLAELTPAATLEIDRQAEGARLQFITPGAGQAMSYREKLDEAKAVLATYADEAAFTADPPAADTYPLLESEVGVQGANVYQVAATVHATYLGWKGVEKVINGTRVQAKAAVDVAGDAAAVQAVLDGLAWPAP